MTLKDLCLSGGGLLLLLMTIIQIAPIKVNPWSTLARGLGKAINTGIMQQIKDLETECQKTNAHVKSLEDTLETHMANMDMKNTISVRIRILRFGDEILQGVHHSKDSFDQVLEDITTYEHYCESHPCFKNNMTQLTVRRIKEVYEERLRLNDFL